MPTHPHSDQDQDRLALCDTVRAFAQSRLARAVAPNENGDGQLSKHAFTELVRAMHALGLPAMLVPDGYGVCVPAAKTHAVDAAIANAQRAVRLHGATGVTVGAGPEKLLRDAWTGYSCDFTGAMLRLSISSALS